jgi:MFS transporter, DHA2 family, multidrug resistance protein
VSASVAVEGAPAGTERALILVSVIMATTLYATTLTIANVALPQMQGDLSASIDQISWVLTFNIVATAIATPPTGWLAARLGRRPLLIGAVAGFTVSTILCGLATSLPELILWRTLQGMFGAPLVPLSQAITLDVYPREQHGTATALWGMGVMLGPILGPTIGGYMTELYDWRWVFFVVAPFGVVALLGCIAFVPDGGRQEGRRLDWLGFAALSVAVAATQLMFDRGQRQDWFASEEIVLWAVLAAGGYYLFVVHSATAERPFFPPRMFLDRNFVVGLILMFVFGLLVFVPMVLIPTMLEGLGGYPVIMIGLLLAPRGIGNLIAMIVCGRLVAHVDPRLMLAAGFLAQGISTWMMAGFNLETGVWQVFWASLLQGFAVGVMFIPLTIITFATLPQAYRTDGTSLFHLLRNIGSSIGISLAVTYLTRSTQHNRAELSLHASRFNDMLALSGADGFWDLASVEGALALAREIDRQAEMIAYVNDFWLMTLLAFASIPLILLATRAGSPPGST